MLPTPETSYSRNVMPSATTIILAGGEGSRLFPLTQSRCKPAVTFAGRYRIIDVAISNSINSSIHEIYIISQFLATTLNNYIANTYLSKPFPKAQIQILSPDATDGRKGLYAGTADAIRKNLNFFANSSSEYFIILSGDQLYTMDLSKLLSFAHERDADLTIATLVVGKEEAKRMGVMKIDNSYQITDFYEKPKTNELLNRFALPKDLALNHGISAHPSFLGSMGIYVFKKQALLNLLKEDPREDFGKHLIPTQLEKGKTFAYTFQGYWEDIGTITSFYEANLRLASANTSCLDLYNENYPIYTASYNLPSARVSNTRVSDSIICDGSIIHADEITNSMIGIRSQIHEGTVIKDSIIMGNQHYLPQTTFTSPIPFSIGKNCHIQKAIIDEHCQIGNNVKLLNKSNIRNFDGEQYYIRDGIIIVPAGTRLQDGFSI